MQFTNVFLGYNKKEDFRILISAWSKAEAETLAEEYQKDAGLQGHFDISEAPERIDDIRFDCDYIITGCNSALKDKEGEKENSTTWLIGVSGSYMDDVLTERVFGTKEQVKEYLLSHAKKDILEHEKEEISDWEFGATELSDIEERPDGTLYIYECWDDRHNDYTATPEMEAKKL